jgi:hypothetical protein
MSERIDSPKNAEAAAAVPAAPDIAPARDAALLRARLVNGLRALPRWAWIASGVALLFAASLAFQAAHRPATEEKSAYRLDKGASSFADEPMAFGGFDARSRLQKVAESSRAVQEGRLAPGERALEIRGPMILRAASLEIVCREIEKTRDAIEQIALRHGGYVAGLRSSGVPSGPRSLEVSLRVPAAELGKALAEIRPLGQVSGERISGEEVTRQYVDLVARLENARHTEQRLLEVLANRTGKLADILEVEREVARVREEIERMDAERRMLEIRAQLAVLEVRVVEIAARELAVAPVSAGTKMWNAFVEGWNGMADGALAVCLFALRAAPSLLLLAGLCFWSARVAWRRMRAQA